MIDEPWINFILEGEKTWEMRSQPTKNRGLIALIRKGSGTVVGVANLAGVHGPFSDEEMDETVSLHHVERGYRDSQKSYNWRTAWELKDVIPFSTPVPYKHKAGAVIFTILYEDDAERVKAEMLVSSDMEFIETPQTEEVSGVAVELKVANPRSAKGMSQVTRRRVLDIAKTVGFAPDVKADNTDRFVKLIVLNSPKLPVSIYVDKITGMDRSGQPNWFKVCIHPKHFDESATHLEDVTAALNHRRGENYFQHSGYVDCPLPEDGGEPFAKAYRVKSWDGLGALFTSLTVGASRNERGPA